MKERILLILIFLHFILPTHSFANYAKVILVRGKVTQLAPGELIARKVSKGEELKVDTSILTEKGSFVRLNLKDGSVLSLGPESKRKSFLKENLDSLQFKLFDTIKSEIAEPIPPVGIFSSSVIIFLLLECC